MLKGSSSVSARVLSRHRWAFAALFSGGISHVLAVWSEKLSPSSLYILFLELSKDWPLFVLSIPLLLNRLAGSDGLFAFLLEIWGRLQCVYQPELSTRVFTLAQIIIPTATRMCFSAPYLVTFSTFFKSAPSRKPENSGTVEMRLAKVSFLSSISLFLTNFFNHQKVVKLHVRVPSKSGWLYWVAKIASWWVEKQKKMEETPIRKTPSLNEPANLPPFLQGGISEPQCLRGILVLVFVSVAVSNA